MRNVSDTSCGENQHTHIMSNNLSFENRAVYENVKKYGTDGRAQIIWRMHITYWIIKAINTHPEYVILIAFPQQQLLSERPLMSRYTYIACFFLNLGIGWRKTVSFITWSFDARKK
jgi:hypothetical protein